MELLNVESYEIKTSKTDHKIPVVNDIHLHSIYNPIKEAESLIDKNNSILESKKELLVFGLGFGYHINIAISRLRKFHNENFSVIVIEPNQKIYRDCVRYNLINESVVKVYAGKSAAELYQDKDLVDFLIKKPGIMAHPASFNLYLKYYKAFLSYQAPKKVSEIVKNITSTDFNSYLLDFENEPSLDSVANQIQRKRELCQEDFLMLAYQNLFKDKVDNKVIHNE